MILRLLLLFTLVPFIELVLLLKLSEWHGWPTTILLVLVTGVLGTVLARLQGFQVWYKIQNELSQGRPPTDALVEGMLILFAGALLITPGILTDLFGFLLLWPAFRSLLARMLKIQLAGKIGLRAGQGFAFQQFNSSSDTPYPEQAPQTQPDPRRGGEVIDVEFTRKTSHTPPGQSRDSAN
ncbi:MAG: FxsA family protein [Planctomycetaceae bacterium]|nr:FxsA family protein [Planctomycetaceae bacterium]